ncbi:hypothetical protein CY35_04G026200 [Sphagnum magellanicum]|jgi:hypothetical protein|nr:hypothetical protein CY35_04G026200 [Sphagnum magellanicum]
MAPVVTYIRNYKLHHKEGLNPKLPSFKLLATSLFSFDMVRSILYRADSIHPYLISRTYRETDENGSSIFEFLFQGHLSLSRNEIPPGSKTPSKVAGSVT